MRKVTGGFRNSNITVEWKLWLRLFMLHINSLSDSLQQQHYLKVYIDPMYPPQAFYRTLFDILLEIASFYRTKKVITI
jgi:hypothetical protein